jgi:vanillate O-demethylase monooxygenase subunit
MHAELLPFWYPIARSEDLRDQPLGALLLEEQLVLYRTHDAVIVAADRCPHRGMRLSLGQCRDHALTCPYHGLVFGHDGNCTQVPAHPQLAPSSRFRLTRYAAVERHGLIWTCLGASPAAFPDLGPDWDDLKFRTVVPDPVPIRASAGRQVEGFIDVAHFAHVHGTTFADPDNPVVPPYTVQTDGMGLRFEYLSRIPNYPRGRGLVADHFTWRRTFEVHPPYLAHLTVDFPQGRLHVLNAACPVARDRTLLFSPVCFDVDLGTDEEVKAFNARIFREDKAIVENQRPNHLQLDCEEASFAADLASVHYRQLLRRLGLVFA